MKQFFKLLICFLVIIIIALTLWWYFFRDNPNILWQIISQQCVPNQQKNNDPTPCSKVDLTERYVLFKDNRGPYHDLIMPVDKITGIESPLLQQENVKPYFYQAWENRAALSEEFGKPINDQLLALTINSKYGRSQNQLHIHLACLNPKVYKTLQKEMSQIDQTWKPLSENLVGHQYLARKLAGTDLRKEDPFKLLQRYADKQGNSIGTYGLALVVNPAGEMILLANHLKIIDMNLASAGELQDYRCAVADN